MTRLISSLISAWVLAGCCIYPGCGSAARKSPVRFLRKIQPSAPTEAAVEPAKQKPPLSGASRDISFPSIKRALTKSGLEVNAVEMRDLPIVEIELVIRSGSAADPGDRPGMAHLVADMLKQGTTRRSAAQLAEAVDFLGARLSVINGQECIYLRMRALSEQLSEALAILAEISMRPAFSQAELKKLKRRELDRLAMLEQNPHFLATREFFRELYGEHPYAHIDATVEAVKKLSRQDLWKWHWQHFAPNNAFLVVAGDASEPAVLDAAERAFQGWSRREAPETKYAEPPARPGRGVIIVDRPPSVQSVILVGNLALERANPDYIPLMVANHIYGGSATSRLFMELRERRGLTYGAYSRLYEKIKIAPVMADTAVRTEATAEAMSAIMRQLERIAAEPAPPSELEDAKRFLVDSFPLSIDTAEKIAELTAYLRIFGLPDGYWDSYRSRIAGVDEAQEREAARRYLRPDQALIVVVGRAAEIKAALTKYGPVKVLDTKGAVIPQNNN